MTIQEFINNVSDRIVDYLRDNKIQDMTEDEKKAVISRFQSKGSKCIIIGFNDKKEGE